MLQMAGERVKNDLKKAQFKAQKASTSFIDYDDMAKSVLQGDAIKEKTPEELDNETQERRSMSEANGFNLSDQGRRNRLPQIKLSREQQ